MKITNSQYVSKIKGRNLFRFVSGFLVRSLNYFYSESKSFLARFRGAKIGHGSNLNFKLALKANSNLVVGKYSVIESNDLDLRNKIIIGDKVIINKEVKIIRESHDVNSKSFDLISNPLEINDYVWIATNSLILPSCHKIAAGAILGAGSVLAKSINNENDIYIGNPACFLKKRKCVHSNIMLESLQGRDFLKYIKARFQ